jgi:phage terminase large subunit-like protein
LPRIKKKIDILNAERDNNRIKAEGSLEAFINLVHPRRMLGNVHRQVINWWTRPDAKTHQLLLLPRDHMKSALIAYRVAWELTRDPTLKILFISSTSNLATKQLKFIKDILTCDNYRLHWPDMINKEEAKREKWTEREISVDHPKRKAESVRDPSIFTAGLTTNIVGMHCDIAVLDDVVVVGNAYTSDGREKVKEQYGYLSSVEHAGSKEWVVGTRYHPLDLYADLIAMEIEQYDNDRNLVSTDSLFERNSDFGIPETVESVGNGSGEFLWPKQQRADGKWFGFDQQALDTKRAQYANKTHFRAQYYNDPHDVGSSVFKRELFQYYEPGWLVQRGGRFFFKEDKLNIVASVDFAFTVNKKSDWTAIVVVGVDGRGNYYILEIDRFQTKSPSEQIRRILKLHEKWGFRKIRAEVVAAQESIVTDLKESYIRPLGLALSVEDYRPGRWSGSKEERILAVLEPKYANRQIWHYPTGNCQILEDELLYANSAHDDVKDALASAVDFAMTMSPTMNLFTFKKDISNGLKFNARFGGVA